MLSQLNTTGKAVQRRLEQLPDWVRRYGLAFLALAIAVGVAEILLHTVGSRAGPVYTFLYLLLIMGGAGLGYGPGLLICTITTFVLPPLLLGRPPRVDPSRLGLLVVISLLISAISASKRRTEAILRKSAEELEERVRQRTLELEANEHRLGEHARLLDLTSDAILTTDRDGIIEFWSRGAEQIYGWTSEEAVGQHAPVFLATVFPQAFSSIESQLLANGSWQGELIQTTKTGTSLKIMSRWALRRTSEGTPCGWLEINTDVTERRRVEERLRHSQRVESIGLLAGGVAHDFNNLLTVLNGYAEMALEDAAPDSNIREHLLEMRAAGERAAALTHQLLAFSRKQLLQPTVLNLNYVVTDLQRMLRRLIGEHIEIVTRLTPTLGNVMADAGQIEQIIMNLAVNARDAMPNGGTLTLETADVTLDESYVGAHPEARTGPHVMLAVTDTGTGMTPAVQARLFEPFFTTKPKGAGTGLGLATVYGMVKQSEGSIWVYSEVGRGTSFKIYLPVTDASAQSAKATPKSDLHGNETILIVEDQSEVRKLASRALERYGYKVLVAANGEEALAVSQGHLEAIHLLLTDVVMPGMTGREVAHSLLQRRPGLRVLFMSGYTEGAFPHNEMVDAQSGYLEKPFTPESLAERVRDVLGPLDARATILVVDEDDGVRRTLCKMLTAERYAVIEAVNGRQALEHVRNGTEFDLVIINLLLLEQEGIEVIQSMKRRFPGLKIIVISETPHLDVFNAASKLGADVGLQGPLDGEDLCRTVQRLLAERAIAEKG